MAWWARPANRDSKIADGELVVVTGIVRAIGQLLEAPLSGLPSVAYASVARIAERRIVQSYGGRLLTAVGDRRVVPFELETRDRVIRIDVPEVELAVAELPLVPRNLERERAFLTKHASGRIDVRTSIFEERCVEPGAMVKVRGLAIAEADPTTGEHGFRDATARFRIVAHDRHPVTIRSAR
jgi:hypothetical protein